MEKNSKNSATKGNEKNENQLEGYDPKRFMLIKIIYTILSVLNMIVLIVSYGQAGLAMNDARVATECIGTMNTKIVSSNANFYSIVFDLTNESLSDDEKQSRVKASQEKIMANFKEIDEIKKEFDSIKEMNEKADKKLEEAWVSIENYREKLSEFDDTIGSSNTDDIAKKIHEEFVNISPIMEETTALIDEAAAIQKDESYKIFSTKAQAMVGLILMLLAIFAVGIAIIILMQRSAKKTALELKKKKEEIEAFSQKLFSAREKTQVNSHTNPLTGLKNRYAMEEDLRVRLETENFYIANLSFDRLNDFNENFGRDFSDKFLVTIAEQLQEDYSKYAEIYNVTSSEFCFVFNSNISEGQAKSFIDAISQKMSSAYTIFNISVQLNVYGCMYYYHAKDYMNLNSLFMILDRTLHKAKDNGGNTVLKVDNE